eukprot:2394445-Rhodomonas_salina.2
MDRNPTSPSRSKHAGPPQQHFLPHPCVVIATSRPVLTSRLFRRCFCRCFALRIFMDTVNANIPRSVGKVELPPAPADIADIPIPKVAADLVG